MFLSVNQRFIAVFLSYCNMQSSDCDDPIPIKPVHKHFFFKAIFKYKKKNL